MRESTETHNDARVVRVGTPYSGRNGIHPPRKERGTLMKALSCAVAISLLVCSTALAEPSTKDTCRAFVLKRADQGYEIDTVDLAANEADKAVDIEATVRLSGRTGVEMEALTAVSVAALTVYDMCKAVDRGMKISEVALKHKSGGKSGSFDAGESGDE